MKCGRFFTSLALASAVIGGALAQQAPTPAAAPPAPPAKEYEQQFLVAGSWFHGVHGLAFTLHLDGPAGGTFVSGSGGDELTIDAVEWIWILSGRGSGTGLLEKELPL